jgi:predicted nucleic acid-binding protein
MHYLDTSALIKRYIAEAASEEFDAYFVDHAPFSITRLTMLEARSALGRRRRRGEIDAAIERSALDEIRLDIQEGALVVHPTHDDDVAFAYHLIDRVHPIPLRSLDALQLSVACHLAASTFATGDKTQAEAARALGLETRTFF